MGNYIHNLELDDGQVLNGELKDLTHHELLSLANHFLRRRQKPQYLAVMQYQHKKFIAPHQPSPPEAA